MNPKQIEALPDLLTPQQVATYLGISRRRVYEYCQLSVTSGGIPSFTIGASRKIEKAKLQEWIEFKKLEAESS